MKVRVIGSYLCPDTLYALNNSLPPKLRSILWTFSPVTML